MVTVDAGRGKKNAVVGLREKKIARGERSTTPYMTKYERARVLGTRALQIRYALACFFTLLKGGGIGYWVLWRRFIAGMLMWYGCMIV